MKKFFFLSLVFLFLFFFAQFEGGKEVWATTVCGYKDISMHGSYNGFCPNGTWNCKNRFGNYNCSDECGSKASCGAMSLDGFVQNGGSGGAVTVSPSAGCSGSIAATCNVAVKWLYWAEYANINYTVAAQVQTADGLTWLSDIDVYGYGDVNGAWFNSEDQFGAGGASVSLGCGKKYQFGIRRPPFEGSWAYLTGYWTYGPTCPVVCTPTVPAQISLISPADAATNQSLNPTLAWNAETSWGNACPGNNNTYKVFFGANPPPETRDLTSYWKFDSDLNDFVDGNNGTNFGTTNTGGRIGNARDFNGSSYININSSLGNFGTGDFSITAWIKSSSATNPQYILSKRSVCGHDNFLNMGITNGKFFGEIDQSASGTNYAGIAGNKTVNNGAWHHVAVTRQGTALRLYVDGAPDGTVYSSGTTNLSNSYTLQLSNSPCSYKFNGQLDEVGVWNKALTAAEIANLYAWENGSLSSIDGTTATSLTKSSLLNNTLYYWAVTANNGSLNSAQSSIWSFRTAPAAVVNSWFQVAGGDVYGATVTDPIPTGATNPYIDLAN